MSALPSRAVRAWAWPAVALLVSAGMLATAHIFQWMGYAPCPLCLRQREVYWAALAIGVLAYVPVRTGRLGLPVLNLLLAAVFAAGLVVAGFHAGIEWKWWPGPASCSGLGAGPVDAGDLAALLEGTATVRAPACEEAAWRMLGLSMAGWNALVSAGLAAISLVFAARKDAQ
jgi:disulfide bond formation protein DsbB